MATALIFICYFISACGYLIRGGSQQIFSGPLKGARYYGGALTTYAFFILAAYFHWSLWLIPIFTIGWFLTIMSAWQPWYSIGSSTSPKRNEGYIGAILHPIFGVPVPASWSASRRIVYDSCGMFIRMLDCLPLFIAAGAFLQPDWHGCLVGAAFGGGFALLTVFIYGGYNWFYPNKWHTDKNLNMAEAVTGWFLLQFVVTEIIVLTATR